MVDVEIDKILIIYVYNTFESLKRKFILMLIIHYTGKGKKENFF